MSDPSNIGQRNNFWTVVILAALGGSFVVPIRASLLGPPLPQAASSTTPAASPSTIQPTPAPSANKSFDNKDTGDEDDSSKQLLTQYLCGGVKPDCVAYQQATRGEYQIDTMIATVPDPAEGLTTNFDNAIEAIERALRAYGMLPDRFNLPWTPGAAATSTKAGVQTSTGTNEEKVESEGISRHAEHEPGLILFRDRDGTSLLMLYMVGETPTSGIHKTAFIRAVQQIVDLRSRFLSGTGERIKVMGPSYSGSATSLHLAIIDAVGHKAENETISFKIISGGATAVDAADFPCTPTSAVAHSPDQVTFQSANLLLSEEKTALESAFNVSGAKAEEFAYLAEESTFYGNAQKQLSRQAPAPRQQPSSEKTRYHWEKDRHCGVSDTPTGTPAAASTPDPRTYLGFPMHIAELENAAAEAEKAAKNGNLDTSMLERKDVPLSAAESRLDIVPLYSSSTTGVHELTLDGLLTTLENPHIHYVVITASDVQDIIYLASQIHAHNSDATVIAFNSNILYQHGDFNPELRGMLVASPYPLFDENQLWTSASSRQHRPIQFPSSPAEGAYNATLALLGKENKDQMLDYAEPYKDESLSKPPLWLTVVGRRSIWPVAALKTDDFEEYTFRGIHAKDGKRQRADPEPVTRFTGFLFVLLCVAAAFGMSTAFASANDSASDATSIQNYLSDREFSALRRERRRYQLAAMLFALVVLAAFALYVFFPAPSFSTFPLGNVNSDATAAMRIYRATHLWNGVSPITPLLLTGAAIAVVAFGAVRRRKSLEIHQLTPILRFCSPSFAGVAKLETEVSCVVKDSFLESPAWQIAILLMLPIYLLVVRSWRGALDGRFPLDGFAFEALYLVLSTIAYACIATAIFRQITIWKATQRLLHRMYWHPSRDGYAKIRDDMPGGDQSAVDIFSADTTFTPLEAALRYARMIADFQFPGGAGGEVPDRLNLRRGMLAGAVQQVEQQLQKNLANRAQGKWMAERLAARELESAMEQVNRHVAYIFEPAWRQDGPGPALPVSDDGRAKPPLILADAYVATRVVDFLRQVMPHLQTLAIASTAAVLLMLLAASSYPFPASDDLLWFGWALVLGAAGSTMWMFVSTNRDRVISLISGTTPGAIDWNARFVRQLTAHLLVPLVVILGAAFPAQLSHLVGWLSSITGGH